MVPAVDRRHAARQTGHRAGVDRLVVVPSPSWPARLDPQHMTPPRGGHRAGVMEPAATSRDAAREAGHRRRVDRFVVSRCRAGRRSCSPSTQRSRRRHAHTCDSRPVATAVDAARQPAHRRRRRTDSSSSRRRVGRRRCDPSTPRPRPSSPRRSDRSRPPSPPRRSTSPLTAVGVSRWRRAVAELARVCCQPQQTTPPPVVTRAAVPMPTATAATPLASPLTAVGVDRLVVVPSPSCPQSFSPQHGRRPPWRHGARLDTWPHRTLPHRRRDR